MQVKLIAVLFAVLMLSGIAAAAVPTIAVLNRDGNFYYPSKVTTIDWTALDTDDPTDFNFILYYVDSPTMTQTEITSLTAAGGAPDRNSNNFCSLPVGTTVQECSYTWTLPTGFDGNYYFDVNGYDITNSDDVNAYSGSLYIDSNACDTAISVANDRVTLSTHCTGAPLEGLGTDTNTIHYGYTRVKKCPDNYSVYVSPFDLSFGEFMICYYSTDGIGNTETTQSYEHTADTDAYNLALLAELLLAALLLMVILGAVVLRGEQISGPLMIGLVIAAVVIAISIYIFAVVL